MIDKSLLHDKMIVHVKSQEEWDELQSCLEQLGATHHEEKFREPYNYRWIEQRSYGLEWLKGQKDSVQYYGDHTLVEFDELCIPAVDTAVLDAMF